MRFVGLLALWGAACAADPSEEAPSEGSTSEAQSTTSTTSGEAVSGPGSEAGPGTSMPSTTTVDPPMTTNAESSGDPTTGPIMLTGMEIYFGTCLPCHGIDGQGTEFGYQVRQPVRDYATWVVRTGRPGDEFKGAEMEPISEEELSDEDLVKVWDFIDTFQRPVDAQGRYRELCSNCHGLDGAGGIVQSDLSGTTLETNMLFVRDGSGGTDYENRMTYMPAFDESVVTDAEIAEIVALFE